MAVSIRPVVLVALICLGANRLPAQDFKVKLPTEEELNRYGLTLSWWGQATLDPRRDELAHLTMDEQNVYAQAQSGIVSAFAGETGRPLWSNLFGAPGLDSFPAVTNDEELLLSRGLRVYSVDKNSGRIRWELELPSHPSTSPELDDRRAYVGMTDGSVLAYELREIYDLYGNGLLPQWTQRANVWRFQGTGEIISPPIAMGSVLTFGSKAGYVYGVTPADRNLKFQFRTGSRILTPLGRSQDLAFIVTENWQMFCLHQPTGRILWEMTASSPVRRQPRVIGKQVFISPFQDGLIALSTESGLSQWRQPAVSDFITASEDWVYASDIAGNLVRINRQTGDVDGRINLRNFSARFANDRTDRIYMSTTDGLIIALRERGSEFPNYHLFPERRPILPILAPDESPEAPAAGTGSM